MDGNKRKCQCFCYCLLPDRYVYHFSCWIMVGRAAKLVFDLLIVLCAFPHGEHFENPFIESNWRYIIFIIFSIGFLYYAIIFSKLEKVVD